MDTFRNGMDPITKRYTNNNGKVKFGGIFSSINQNFDFATGKFDLDTPDLTVTVLFKRSQWKGYQFLYFEHTD